MTLRNDFLRVIVNPSAENTRGRLVYRPRSEQLIEYLAHASASDNEKENTGDSADDGARQDESDKQKRTQREYVERRLSETAEFEARARGVPVRR